MRYQTLGRSGLVVSVVGLGCNNMGMRLDLDGTRVVIDAAQDAGITLLDTAEMYGGAVPGTSEQLLGEVLKGRREQFVLATKFGHARVNPWGPSAGGNGSRGWVRRSVLASLQRLQTDWIDLYQLHTPDPTTPFEETVGAMQELVTEGLVRYLGHSNLAGWQISSFAHLAGGDPAFVSAQNHYSLLERDVEAEVVPACLHHGLGVLPYFPLANGLLTGKVTRADGVPADSRLAGRDGYVTEDKLDRVEGLQSLAAEWGVSLLDLAVGGLAAQPAVGSVIAGATRPEQVAANAAAGDWQPTAEQLAAIDAVCPARRPE